MNIAICDDNPKIVGQIETLLLSFLRMTRINLVMRRFSQENHW